MWGFVDKVVYINLDHRQDRRDTMMKFFQEGGIPSEKIIRFPAIRHEIGMIGCGQSHIGVLRMAKEKGWGNILVLEDDIEWIDFKESYLKLESLVSSQTWDVCMLTGRYLNVQDVKVNIALHTNAYIVAKHYVPTLLDNFETGQRKLLEPFRLPFQKINMKQRAMADHIHHIDVYWCKLQKEDTWICMNPQMCSQTESYSDINGAVMKVPNGVINETSVLKIMIQNAFY
jgi:glycosyl transferase family 25